MPENDSCLKYRGILQTTPTEDGYEGDISEYGKWWKGKN
jgi:hypothetical protein